MLGDSILPQSLSQQNNENTQCGSQLLEIKGGLYCNFERSKFAVLLNDSNNLCISGIATGATPQEAFTLAMNELLQKFEKWGAK